MMYSTSLKGKIAWVTGSSRGIGRTIAEFLAECGADVAIHGRSDARLVQYGEGTTLEDAANRLSARFGIRALPVHADLGNEEEARRAAAEVREKLGIPDLLICCAGGDIPEKGGQSVLSFESEIFHAVLRANLDSTVYCCREIVPEMVKRGSGCMVTIGSIAGCGGWKTAGRLAPYPTAKAAVHEYTRCLAAYVRHAGVRVNCVIPGNINTPRTRELYGGDRITPTPGLSSLEHVGTPEDIASLVLFLCSEGGRYISGQCIRVDGGEQLSPC